MNKCSQFRIFCLSFTSCWKIKNIGSTIIRDLPFYHGKYISLTNVSHSLNEIIKENFKRFPMNGSWRIKKNVVPQPLL